MSRAISEYRSVEEVTEANRSIGWDVEYRQLKAARYRGEFCATTSGQITTITESTTQAVNVTGSPPPGCAVLMFFGLSDVPVSVNGVSLANSPGLCLFESGSCLDISTFGAARINQLIIPQKILDTFEPQLSRESFFNPMVEAPLGQAGYDLISNINSGTSLSNAVSADVIGQLIGRSVRVFARESDLKSRRTRSSRHRSLVLRKAKDFISNHYASVISISEIADVAGTSQRSLERYFAGAYGVSIIAYINAYRMFKARALILRSSPESIMVSLVAKQCGFRHMSRFSQQYAQYFGESPRVTLATNFGAVGSHTGTAKRSSKRSYSRAF